NLKIIVKILREQSQVDEIYHGKKEEIDQTIISFLKKRFKTTPLSLIYKLFRTKKIKIDETNVRYYHRRLKEGEEVEIRDNYLQKSNLAVYPLSQSKIYFEIIYEDQNILLVLKEHGITMPSLDNAVRYYLAEKIRERKLLAYQVYNLRDFAVK
ncbi:1545_t:CDS:2, partial [Cetraspora pellucida]